MNLRSWKISFSVCSRLIVKRMRRLRSRSRTPAAKMQRPRIRRTPVPPRLRVAVQRLANKRKWPTTSSPKSRRPPSRNNSRPANRKPGRSRIRHQRAIATGGSSRQKSAAAGNPQSGSPSGESSMLNKLKDSMANLLSMMKPQSGASTGKPQTGKSRDGNSQDSRKQSDQASDSANAEPGADSAQPGGAKSSGAGQSSKPGSGQAAWYGCRQ